MSGAVHPSTGSSDRGDTAQDHASENDSSKRHASKERISGWEWGVGGVGLVLVVAALVVLIVYGMTGTSKPASVIIRTTAVIRVPTGWLVRYEAKNDGDGTVAGLHLHATLARGSDTLETADAELSYLPGRSTRRGGIFLHHDPREGTFEIRPQGYEEP